MSDARPWIYGTDHDGPTPRAPPPATSTCTWWAGRCSTDRGLYGPGGRSDYEPRPGDPDRWDWQGDTPDPATFTPAAVCPYVIPAPGTSST